MTNIPPSNQAMEDTFSSEEACAEYLASVRWPDGVVCPACGHDKLWRSNKGRTLECSACGHKTNVMAGTVFQDTHLPLSVWFRLMWLLMSQKYGANATGLMRVFKIGYTTAWNVLHKLRRVMVRADRAKLRGAVEIDETFVGASEEGLAGRGAQSKVMVLVAVELPDGKKIGRIRLKSIENAKGATLQEFIQANVEPGATVVTDGFRGYSGVAGLGYSHIVKVMKKDKNALTHVHLIISLLKRWLLGTCQGAVSEQYMDYYLDEYVFRFNRRTSRSRGKLFGRLMEQAVATPPTTRKDLLVRPAVKKESKAKRAARAAEFRASTGTP